MGSDDGTVFATQRNLQVVVNSKLEFSDYEKRELVIRNVRNKTLTPHTIILYTYVCVHAIYLYIYSNSHLYRAGIYTYIMYIFIVKHALL